VLKKKKRIVLLQVSKDTDAWLCVHFSTPHSRVNLDIFLGSKHATGLHVTIQHGLEFVDCLFKTKNIDVVSIHAREENSYINRHRCVMARMIAFLHVYDNKKEVPRTRVHST
jgi:hypothetical protein